MKVGVRASAAWVAVLLLLVGCTGQVEVQPPADTGTAGVVSSAPTPSQTPVPGPTIAPPPTRPVAPDTLDDPTPEGALSAIRYFYDLYPYAYATGDTEGLKEISGNACGYCMKVTDRIEKYKADGGEAAGFMVEFADAKYDEETATPFHVDFQVWFEVAPGVVRLSPGGAVEGVHGQKLDLLVSVDLEETWELGKVLEVDSAS